MQTIFSTAQTFMLQNARLLERLLFEVRFGQGSPESVASLVRACQNPDGGLGQALEPDLRCAESQPLFVEIGLQALHEAGTRDPEWARQLCPYLESVADPAGLVPPIVESALRAPHAAHWTEHALAPDFNPTAAICGYLLEQGVEHPWLERATQACLAILLQDPPREAHSLLCAARLVEALPDGEAADQLWQRVAESLPGASFFIPEAPVQGYGLTPLHFATCPDSPWRRLFTNAQIEGHLQDLLGRQQPDGGWKIYWQAPSPGAELEWRARWTLEALEVLVAYGVVEVK